MKSDSKASKEKLSKEGRLPRVWNKRVDPASDRDFMNKNPRPVTLEDLNGDYATIGLRHVPVKGQWVNSGNTRIYEDGTIDLTTFRKLLRQWHDISLEPGGSSSDKLRHNFGSCLRLNNGFFRAKDWKVVIDEIARRDLYMFDTWGYLPGYPSLYEGGSGAFVTDEIQSYVLKRLGSRFLGWDIGELDGRWFWHVEQTYPAIVTREKGWKYFQEWFACVLKDLRNYCTTLCSLTYPHYFIEMGGQRMIGAEFLQALPSIPMRASFIRGAARQYQILWYAGISVWNKFGWKNFEANKAHAAHSGSQSGPDHGPPLSLMEKVWYVLYMYGVNIQGFECSQFIKPPGASEEYLSPLGELQLKAVKFSHNFKSRRGVQYCPVAAVLDFHSGWAPPRHIYGDNLFNTWGTVPYEQGDHQIDLFFREMFPGYQECAFFHDNRGYLTTTPYGDIVDVLLANVREDILSRYRVVCILGETRIEGDILENLVHYVRAGGEVIWSYHQLSEGAKQLVSLRDRKHTLESKFSISLVQGEKVIEEEPYSYPEISVEDGEVWLASDQKKPLITSLKLGEGRIVTIIPPFGLGHRKEIGLTVPLSFPADVYRNMDPDFGFHFLYWDEALPSPYAFLNGVKKIWFDYINSFNLVEVVASDVIGWNDPRIAEEYGINTKQLLRRVHVQVITSLRPEPDKIVVTVVNNRSCPVYGRLKVKGAKIIRALDVLREDREISLTKDGRLNFNLSPHDFCDRTFLIAELHLDKPIVEFIE